VDVRRIPDGRIAVIAMPGRMVKEVETGAAEPRPAVLYLLASQQDRWLIDDAVGELQNIVDDATPVS
jgi:hypothetical protein